MVINRVENPGVNPDMIVSFFSQNNIPLLPRGIKYNRFSRMISPSLSPMEPMYPVQAKLLEFFLLNQNQVLDYQNIYKALYPNDYEYPDNISLIWTEVCKLRKNLMTILPNRLEKDVIITIRESGYIWDNPLNKEDATYPQPRKISDDFYYDYFHRAITDISRAKFFFIREQNQLFEFLIHFPNEIVDYNTLGSLIPGYASFNTLIRISKRTLKKELNQIFPDLGSALQTVRGQGFIWIQNL